MQDDKQVQPELCDGNDNFKERLLTTTPTLTQAASASITKPSIKLETWSGDAVYPRSAKNAGALPSTALLVAVGNKVWTTEG